MRSPVLSAARAGLICGSIVSLLAVTLFMMALSADPDSGAGWSYFLVVPMWPMGAIAAVVVHVWSVREARSLLAALIAGVLAALSIIGVTSLFTDEAGTMAAFFVVPMGAIVFYPAFLALGAWTVGGTQPAPLRAGVGLLTGALGVLCLALG
ncbi:hypothetical protein [Nonomuraea longicatena]|uniref:Uncharacterized protein n=1 Tax=Nonomuraea longicatena TaxID=83682 RepID=A0ABN1PTM9_9ACTN